MEQSSIQHRLTPSSRFNRPFSSEKRIEIPEERRKWKRRRRRRRIEDENGEKDGEEEANGKKKKRLENAG